MIGFSQPPSSSILTLNQDEYVGIPLNHPQSYHTFMYQHLFSHIDILPQNTHILDGTAENLEAECVAFEQKIKNSGGIDLFLAGLGADGHIAFNEPGSSLASRTRVKTLAYDTILANSRFFGNDLGQVPKMALTVGVQTVLEAREIVVIVTGNSKSMATKMCVEGGVNHMWTGSALQLHPHPMLVVDEDATQELLVRTVKYFKSIEEVAKSQGFEQILPSAARTGRKTLSKSDDQTLHIGNGMRQNDLAAHSEEAEMLQKEIESLKLQNMRPLTSTYLAAPATEYPVRSQSPDKELRGQSGIGRSVTPELINESMGSRIIDGDGSSEGKKTESGIARAAMQELKNESMYSRVEKGSNSLGVPRSDEPSRSTTPDLVNDSMRSRVGDEQTKQAVPTFLAAPTASYPIRSVTPDLLNDSMHSRVVGAV